MLEDVIIFFRGCGFLVRDCIYFLWWYLYKINYYFEDISKFVLNVYNDFLEDIIIYI